MRFFTKHREPDTTITVPDTYDPEHDESGATTAEYGLLAGGVALTSGLLYQILESEWFKQLMKDLLEALFTVFMEMLKGLSSGAISLPTMLF